MTNTLETAKSFMGSEHIWKVTPKYGITDGVKWLSSIIGEDLFHKLMYLIDNWNNYRYPFLSIHLIVEDGKCQMKITDGNDLILADVPWYDDNFPLDDGEYVLFCYNFVVMLASEY